MNYIGKICAVTGHDTVKVEFVKRQSGTMLFMTNREDVDEALPTVYIRKVLADPQINSRMQYSFQGVGDIVLK
jgi:hypothetical protein